MQASKTTTPAELSPSLEEPDAPPIAPEDRPRWGFTVGCAIAVGLVFLVLGALKGRAPPPETRARSSSPASAGPDPFADVEVAPLPLQNTLPALLSPTLPLRAGLHAKVTLGAVTVSGRLPPEVIRRILQQNRGRLRLCYEAGLRNNPTLQGRVSLRIVIGRDGATSMVANAGSDLPDAGVVLCATRAFYGLSFPPPDAGIVSVTYPIYFRPS